MKRNFQLLACLVALVFGVAACESEKDDAPNEAMPEVEETQEADEAGEDEMPMDEHAHHDMGGGSQADIPEDQTMEGPTEGGNFYVVVTPKPSPIPFQELFELDVKVYESDNKEKLADGVKLDQVRATMPAHGHGMKNEPKVAANDDGTFTVKGMRFHMQGEGKDGRWVVETVLNQDGTIDQAKFDAQCCRE